jgi:hypothetical protein
VSETTEVRAYLLRRATGVVGPGSPRDIWNLGEFFGGAIQQLHNPLAEEGAYDFLPDGRAEITLPALLHERRLANIALHEYGHYVSEERPVGESDPLTERARLRSEREADEFADAFVLPREVIEALHCMADAYELAEDFGIPLDWIERRRDTLRGVSQLHITEPPGWSAWPHYRVEHLRHPTVPRFRLIPTSPYAVPLEIPFSPRMYTPTLKALHWDLLALRLHEFHHKHHAGAYVQVEEAGMLLAELLPPRIRRSPTRRNR